MGLWKRNGGGRAFLTLNVTAYLALVQVADDRDCSMATALEELLAAHEARSRRRAA